MRTLERIFRTYDHRAMFTVIRDTDARQSEVWFFPADGREMRHVRTFEHGRDAAAKAAQLADTIDELITQPAWDKAVAS
jgi:hypothetical protein